MKLPEKKQRWVYHAEALPQTAGEGVTRRVLAYTDGLMCVENTFEKGAVGALHHHPHTQITYVVSGAFDFTVDGVTPSADTIRSGEYPFLNNYYVVMKAGLPDDDPTSVLYHWILSDEGQKLVSHEGYVSVSAVEDEA